MCDRLWHAPCPGGGQELEKSILFRQFRWMPVMYDERTGDE